MSIDYSLEDFSVSEERGYSICKDFFGNKLKIDEDNRQDVVKYYTDIVAEMFPIFECGYAQEKSNIFYNRQNGTYRCMYLKNEFNDQLGLVVDEYFSHHTCLIEVGVNFNSECSDLYVKLCWRNVCTDEKSNDYIFYSCPELNRLYRKKFQEKNFKFLSINFKHCVDNFLKMSEI